MSNYTTKPSAVKEIRERFPDLDLAYFFIIAYDRDAQHAGKDLKLVGSVCVDDRVMRFPARFNRFVNDLFSACAFLYDQRCPEELFWLVEYLPCRYKEFEVAFGVLTDTEAALITDAILPFTLSSPGAPKTYSRRPFLNLLMVFIPQSK